MSGKKQKQLRAKMNQEPPPSRASQWSKHLIGLSGLSILGLFMAYLTLTPKVSMTPTSPSKPSDPFTWRFILANDGHMNLYDTIAECHLTNIVFQEKKDVTIDTLIIQEPWRKIEKIGNGDKTTIECLFPHLIALPVVKNIRENPIVEANLLILVRYRTRPNVWGTRQEFFYGTKVGSSGQLEWFPMIAPVEVLEHYPPA